MSLRCIVTSHPCGTDTWRKGSACHCENCQTWLLATLDVERARAEQAERELSTAMQVIRDTCEDMECLPSCDSVAHDERCPVAYPAFAWRVLREELTRLRRENAALRYMTTDPRTAEG